LNIQFFIIAALLY